MKFPDNASIESLQKIVSECDDSLGHHLIWINNDGEVYITFVKVGQSSFTRRQLWHNNGVIYMFETLSQCSGYVGPHAALDLEWMSTLHAFLFEGYLRHKI